MDLLSDRSWVTDGGLETYLIFHQGLDLPDFAAFPLVEDEIGRQHLVRYYDGFADVARRVGGTTGLMLESCTWRANPDWGARSGYDAAALERVNRSAIELLHRQRDRHDDLEVLVGGSVGPRGDGYEPGERLEPERYADYHRPQLAAFHTADADLATAYTLAGADEAIGIVAAARDVGLPVAISFTVETDGRLPDGTLLRDAVAAVEVTGPPDWYLVNCAHPTHVAPALTAGPSDDGAWLERVAGLRPNASRLSHAELDEAEQLDEGDLDDLATTADQLRSLLPSLRIVGGCCGTDARHVAALWGV